MNDQQIGSAERFARWADVWRMTRFLEHTDEAGLVPDLLAVPTTVRYGLSSLVLGSGNPGPQPCSLEPGAHVIAMMLVDAGEAEVVLGGRKTSLRAGDTLFWDGEVQLALDISVPVHRRVLLFPRSSIIELCPEYETLLEAPIRDQGDLVATLFDVVQLLRHRMPLMAPRIRQTATDLLLQLVAGLEPGFRPVRDRQQAQMLDRILQYIDDNLMEPTLFPASIAAAHAISERTLYSLFNGLGVPVSAHVRERRLQQGYRDVMQNPDEPLARIADRWGFASAAHFSRLFRNRFGMPPSRLRATSAHPSTQSR